MKELFCLFCSEKKKSYIFLDADVMLTDVCQYRSGLQSGQPKDIKLLNLLCWMKYSAYNNLNYIQNTYLYIVSLVIYMYRQSIYNITEWHIYIQCWNVIRPASKAKCLWHNAYFHISSSWDFLLHEFSTTAVTNTERSISGHTVLCLKFLSACLVIIC